MTALRIALTELRRITGGRLPRLAVLAMIAIPTVYAGLYLYTNHDPYSRLSHVPAALVVEDAGADGPDGERLNAGEAVADELISSKSFGWARVDRADAQAGVRDGSYDFALIIPGDFSAALTGATHLAPERARLTMLTNDANSYLSTTIADTVTDRVRDSIAEQVSERAATTFLLGFADARSGMLQAAQGAGQLVDGLATARGGARELTDGSGELADGAGQVAAGADELASGLGTMASKVRPLPRQTATLADGAGQVADADAEIASIGRRVAEVASTAQQRWQEGRAELQGALASAGLDAQQQAAALAVYDRAGRPIERVDERARSASEQLDELASGAAQVAEGARTLASAMPELVTGVNEAHDGARQLSDGAGQVEDGATRLHSGARELRAGIRDLHAGAVQLQEGLQSGAEQIPAVDEESRQQIARTISDPVAVRSASQAKADSYGAGLAPFFLSLAAWIGGYVLFLLVRPLSQRALAANQLSWRVALGGWIPPALIGLAQVTVMLAVVAFALGIEPANIPGTLLFLLLVSATFVAIIHLLNAWLGTPGQFLGLVLMVLQLVTSGGTFPWQTIPESMHWLHHLLPMSYAVDGLRQLMYGGLEARVLTSVLVLTAYLAGALLLTSLVARRQRVWTPKRVKPELVL